MNTVFSFRKLARAALLSVAVLAAFTASSTSAATSKPRVATGAVKHVRGTSGELEAAVDPKGLETSYFFEYGPTVAYGKTTKTESAGKGTTALRVGQQVTGILPGYHYRVVATFVSLKGVTERVDGRDRSFAGGKTSKLRFEIAKGKENELVAQYGGTTELSGGLTGIGNTSHGLILQASPYPYTSPFTTVGTPILSNLSGHFVFRIARLTQSTEFRVLTTDRRPLYSPNTTVHVEPKLILHIRPAAGRGNYRIYGTVAPARLRGLLYIQEMVAQRPGSTKEGPRARSINSVAVRRGSSTKAKFSIVMTLSGSKSYRVYLKLPQKGSLISGHSNEVFVHAPKLVAHRGAKHAKGKRTRKTAKKK